MGRKVSSLVVAALCAGAFADRNVDVKRQIQARYAAWSKAYMAYDVDKLLSILAPDYSLTAADGDTMSRKVYAASLSLRKSAHNDPKSYSTTIVKLTTHGAFADVVAIETMTMARIDPVTHTAETVIHKHRYLDTWVDSRSIWLLSKTLTVKESTTVKPRRSDSSKGL